MSETHDTLSAWALPPPAARAEGHEAPIRCFDSLEQAMAFLALLPPIFAAPRNLDEAA